ncbi:hypothetical protein QFC21_002309 [Naganishia friedmannii]|uniref:Uncharacterized protein n=1 Tax=Naganishia friedmannii TaxID=89922 RepID=A0ACC2VZM8_9TREE|nr:hypothetical protein QFC21_002309 [Naganishia friedmannii]
MTATTPLFPTAATTSDLFVNPRTATTSTTAPTTTSNNNYPSSGWGGYGGQSSYFQTVVISLVALAVLLIISVGGEEWPFPTLPANGRAGRRRKEEKDFGETPEMYECLLDVQSGVGAKEFLLASTEASPDVWGGTQDITERSQTTMPIIAVQDDLDLTQWQPVTVTSLSTKALSGSTTLSAQPANNSSAMGQSSRPSNLFSRTLSSSRSMFALGGLTPAEGNNMNTPAVDQRHSTFTPSSGFTEVPLNVTYLIAMPSALRDTSTANHRQHQATGLADEEDQEEIPEVALGVSNVNLTIPGLSITSTSAPSAAAHGAPATANTLDASRINLFRKSENRQHQTGTGAAQVGDEQTNPRNSAIGPDGTLDLVALLNQ